MDALPAEIVEHIIASSPEILGPREAIQGEQFGLWFFLKKGLRFHFDTGTSLKYPFWNFFFV